MAMVCDACSSKFGREDGQSTLNVRPPHIAYKMVQAFITAGLPVPSPRGHEEFDLCLGCTAKALAHLGLQTDVCEVPQLPEPPPEPSKEPYAGALSLEDLKTLGLSEDPPAGALTPEDLKTLGLSEDPPLDPPCGGLTATDLKALGIDPT